MTTNNDPQDTKPPRRGRKWALGCLIAVIVFLAVAAFALTAATSWDTGNSAWPNMPQFTTAAVEVHGFGSLFDALEKDAAVDSLILWLREQAETNREEDVAARMVERYRDFYKPLRLLMTPEIMLFGLTGEEEEIPFGIVLMPKWIHFLARLVSHGEGAINVYEENGQPELYYAYKNGWCVVSPASAVVEEIIANWGAGLHDLGSPAAQTTPYVALALHSGPFEKATLALTESAQVETKPAANPFLAGSTPLDAPAAAPTPDRHGAEKQGVWRVLLRPTANAWRLDGGWQARGDQAAEQGFVVPDLLFGPLYEGAPGEKNMKLDFVFTMPYSPVADQGKWIETIAGKSSLKRDHPLQFLIWDWLRNAWLANASGDFTFRAGDPVRERKNAAPAMPVFTLGWTMNENISTTRDRFNQALDRILESATAPGGNLAVQILKKSVSVKPFANSMGSGKTVVLPEVAAYAMQPTWMLADSSRDRPGEGYLATDPEGIPGLSDVDRFEWPGFVLNDSPDSRRVFALSGIWDISGPFKDSLFRIAEELIMFGKSFDKHKAAAAGEALKVSQRLFDMYPTGKSSAFYDPDTGNCAFKAAIDR